MDSLVFVLLLLALIPIGLLYVLVSHQNLKRRVRELEARVAKHEAAPVAETTTPYQSVTQRMHATEPEATKDARKWVPPEMTESAGAPKSASLSTTAKDTPDTRPQPVSARTTSDAEHAPEGPPESIVFTSQRMDALGGWLSKNWFYAVSAASLVLAGIFLVLYGMEQGLLPPWVRVSAAAAFGFALIIGGEVIRRRFGDEEEKATAYLPSTFSGAGVVTLFGAILSARLLYDFISPEIALGSMALVGAGAMVLGWYYGPLLAAIGIVGAMVAPFLVGGSADTTHFLLAYFALIALMGLAIDTVRRWAWVSVIALVMGYGSAGLVTLLTGDTSALLGLVVFSFVMSALAICVPVRQLRPDHAGTRLSMIGRARSGEAPWPEFPTRLAGGALAASTIFILLCGFDTSNEPLFWVSILALTALVAGILIWADRAPALLDLVVLPAVALVVQAAGGAGIWWEYQIAAAQPEAEIPLMATYIIGIGIFVSAAAAWRSIKDGRSPLFTALVAALFAPVLALTLDVSWRPIVAVGLFAWALHAMAIAAVMVAMATRFARLDGEGERERMSFAVLSALACISFALAILFSAQALTVALAATIVAATWLDRKFNLPLMGLYVAAGVIAVGFRLVVDPGLLWAIDAPMLDVLISYVGAIGAFAAANVFAKQSARQRDEVMLETALMSALGVFLSVLLYRAISLWAVEQSITSHWALGIGAMIWLCLGLAQFKRMEIGGHLAKVRLVLGALYTVFAGLLVIAAVGQSSPLVNNASYNLVLGVPVLNTMLVAYVLPAALSLLMWKWLPARFDMSKRGALVISLALGAFWGGLSIRHFWQGAQGMPLSTGIGPGELYSYTVVLLALGGGAFYQSIARGDQVLRKVGLGVIGLAVAKVFIVDISGLGGLVRVFSFLFLGLSLAGLAWLNRWAQLQGKAGQDTGSDPDTPDAPQ